MNTLKLSVITLASGLGFAAIQGCSSNQTENKESKPNTAIDLANFDTTINATEDFYHFVNGNWIKNNPIPASESAWGSFNVLNDQNTKNLRAILEEAANEKNIEAGSIKQKVGDFFAVGMDSAKLESEGITPLKAEFDMIDAMKTPDDLTKEVAHLHMVGPNVIFAFDVSQDQKSSTQNIFYIGQAGIGLPDRDYYLDKGPEADEIRKKYVAHLTKMFELMGEKPADAAAKAQVIMKIETGLSTASMTRVQLRDPEAQYNKKTIKELAALTPSFNWNLYFETLGAKNVNDIIVGQPEFFKEMEKQLKSVSMNDWKTYFRWNLINVTAGKLNSALVQEHFNFFGTELNGAKELKPRWKRCLELVDQCIGEALGQLYVEKHFSADSKQRVKTMVENMIAVYKERIESLDWMSAETKKKAQEKLGTFMLKLGYPDKWRDYSSLDIKRDAYVLNFLRSNEFETKRRIARLGQPVDRTEWGMSPQTVNAYYNPTLNEIVFPAGIMQPPFFNPDADDAVNYGSMGAVIGHELTHGFDDQGCQYDAQGNLKNWWTEEDKAKFKAKTDMIVKQFNGYVAIDSMHVNGELTLGENIADLGGLTLGYQALKKSMEGKPATEKINGFTPEQRFFISWAQGWRTNMRPEYLKQMVKTNPHSPGNFRVVGPLSNMKEFYDAFNVKEGNAMYRAERALVW